MRIIFRADGSVASGSGHVMRTSAVAEEAIRRGHDCYFVGQIEGLPWVSERVGALGFRGFYSDLADLPFDTKTSILFLDSYTLNPFDPQIQKENWRRVISINDESTPQYESDLQICPGLKEGNTHSDSPSKLSGPLYILIRNGITKSRKSENGSGPLQILVVAGGTDPFGLSQAISEMLDAFGNPLEVHYFSNKNFVSISGHKYVSHVPGNSLDAIANNFDLVFTTASTSSFEFIAREIPTAVVCAVDNQESYYKEMGEIGCAMPVGRFTNSAGWVFEFDRIKDLVTNQVSRDYLKQKTSELVDLKGASRVLDIIELKFKE